MEVPKLRFKADDGSDFPDWEEMTLGDVGSVAMCKRVFKEQTREVGDVPFFKIGTFGSVPDAYISKSLFDELKSKYAYPEVGTILLSASGTIGRQVEYQGEDAYYQDSNIVWLEHDDTVLDSYLKQFYSVVKWQGLEGSTIKRLYNKTILDTPFYRPSLPEQHKIADLLSAVDDVISAQEAEVAAWEKRKKGVMQKLFRQEVRFKADDGSDFPDWEEKALGDLGHFVRGLSYDKTQVLDEGSDASGTAVLRSNNINSDGTLNYRDDVQLVSKEPSSEQRLCENDVVICMANGSNRLVGKAARYDGGYDAGQITVGAFCGIFRTNSPLVPWWFQSDDYKSFLHLSRQGGNGALANLKGRDIEAISLPFPSSTIEQRKIADCLSALDHVIIKAKNELAKWQELKKGLLQQMFV